MATDIPGFGRIAFNPVGKDVESADGVLHAATLTPTANEVFRANGRGSSQLKAATGRLQTDVGIALYGYNPDVQLHVGRLLTINDVVVDGNEKKGWAAAVCSDRTHNHRAPRLFFVRGITQQPEKLICDMISKKK